MKLEVGMYIRTKEGIRKIESIYKNLYELNKSLHYNYPEGHDLYEEDVEEVVLKASHTLLGNDEEPCLIEVGDILKINNEKYEVIYDESYEKLGILIPSRKELSIRHSALEYVFKKYNVSIVTKEQFEQMQYKVGD